MSKHLVKSEAISVFLCRLFWRWNLFFILQNTRFITCVNQGIKKKRLSHYVTESFLGADCIKTNMSTSVDCWWRNTFSEEGNQLILWSVQTRQVLTNITDETAITLRTVEVQTKSVVNHQNKIQSTTDWLVLGWYWVQVCKLPAPLKLRDYQTNICLTLPVLCFFSTLWSSI